ncbi:hypothetical protein [Priestia aryabhattai]|uniref:hypothetical protein n=1 Tax=Priestia aryabhattai TaxID=412384 RepID=UPI0030CD6A5F
MKFLKELFNELMTLKWLIFSVVSFIFGLSLKKEIIYLAMEYKSQINKWDLIILFINDLYIVIYFILPIWIFLSTYTIFQNFNYNLLIRIGSYTKWIFYTLGKVYKYLISIFIIWILDGFILSFNLPFQMDWSPLSNINTYTNKVLFIYESQGLTPIFSVFSQIIMFTLFALTVHILLTTIFLATKNKTILLTCSLLICFSAIFSFRIFSEKLKILSLPNYMFLYHSYESFKSLIIGPSILIGIIIICFISSHYIDSLKQNNLKELILKNKRYIIYIALCLFGIIIPTINSKIKLITVWDSLYYRFIGVSNEGFNFNNYIFSCIAFLGFVYLFQLYLNRIMTERLYYLVIRYKSIETWFVQLLKGTFLTIPILLLGFLLITISVGILLGQSLDYKITIVNSVPLNYIIYHFFINGSLQLVNYVLIIFIISWISKEVFHSLIGIGIMMLLMLPMININGILPIGLNSLGYITNNFSDVIKITIILFIYLIIELFIIINILKKRDISL